ncbi:M48 family metallopeptidase [Actinoplanes sp. NPDC023801]|uniref:M48 family metallopeptidase n=1 Tax=Actinoplanes sp. NPDC023801 TaxID=3154595 RepID=UPI0033CF19B0
MIASLRALLALIMLAGVYLGAALMVLAWVVFAVLAVWVFGSRSASQQFNTTPILAATGTAVAVGLVVREVVRMSRPPGPRAGSVAVIRSRVPELWGLVSDLAEQIGIRPPDEIRLTGDANAAVTDDAWLLGLGPGRRRLYVGVPLLVALRPEQLRAVLAHELGHVAHGHARFTEPAHRSHAALVASRERIREAMVANLLIAFYSGFLMIGARLAVVVTYHLVRPVRHRQELEADRIAARVAGSREIAAGLRAAAAVGIAWSCWETRSFTDFGSAVRDPGYAPTWKSLCDEASRLPADGFHPALAERLRSLAAHPCDPPSETAPDLRATLPLSVLSLLEGPAATAATPLLAAGGRRSAAGGDWPTDDDRPMAEEQMDASDHSRMADHVRPREVRPRRHEPAPRRTITITPSLDPEVRRRHRAVAYISLTVLLGLLLVGGLRWATDEVEKPWYQQPRTPWTIQPYLPYTPAPWPQYPLEQPMPTLDKPLPTFDWPLPTLDAPPDLLRPPPRDIGSP